MLIYSSVNHQSYAERNWTACKNTIIFSTYQIILNIFNKWFIYSIILAIVQHVLYIVCELSRAWNVSDNCYWHTCSMAFVTAVPEAWYDCDNKLGTTVTISLVQLWQQLLLIYKEFAYWVIIIGWLHLWVIHISGWLIITLIIIHVDYFCCFCLEMQINSVISKLK